MHIESFDSIEDAYAAMDAAERSANESLHPLQKRLRDGDEETQFWVRPTTEVGLIFGRAWSWREEALSALGYVPGVEWGSLVEVAIGPSALADMVAKAAVPEGHEVEEWTEVRDEAVYSIASSAERRLRGYLFGEAYSAPFPEGELGDTHVANAWPISEAAFEEARATGWRANHVVGARSDEAARRFGGTPVLVRELDALEGAARSRG